MVAILLKSRYRVLRELADGRFGKTFLAEDTQMPSGKKCLIKQFKPINDRPQIERLIREKFQREAVTLETLGDSNSQIPRLYAYFEESGEFYLVQEWIQGQTLSDRVRQTGCLGESEVKEILLNLLPVLQDIHSKGIIHRDLKPDNIILRSRDGKPVLVDFGLVKETMGITVSADGRAKSAVVVGTPGFIPSEQAAGKPLFASDLYALGLTAIYLLTGKTPQELKTNPLTGDLDWRHGINVSPSFAAILDKTIHPSARDRYMNAPAMLTALQQLDIHIPPPPIISPPPKSPPPQSPPPPSPPPQSISSRPAISPPQSPPPQSISSRPAISPPESPPPQSPPLESSAVAQTPTTPTTITPQSPPPPTIISTPGKGSEGRTFSAAVSPGINRKEKSNTSAATGIATWVKAGLIVLAGLVALAVLLVAIGYVTRSKTNSSSDNPNAPPEQNSEPSPLTSTPSGNSQPNAVTPQPTLTPQNLSEPVKIGQLKTYTYNTDLFSINVPPDWQRRDRSTIREAIVSWYDPTENAAIVVDVFSREAFGQTGQIPPDRLSRFLARAAQQVYRSQPNFQLAATEAANNGWRRISWSYTVTDRQGKKGKMLGYGSVRQDNDKISYIHFVVPEVQYPQMRSPMSKITNSYSINPTAPLP